LSNKYLYFIRHTIAYFDILTRGHFNEILVRALDRSDVITDDIEVTRAVDVRVVSMAFARFRYVYYIFQRRRVLGVHMEIDAYNGCTLVKSCPTHTRAYHERAMRVQHNGIVSQTYVDNNICAWLLLFSAVYSTFGRGKSRTCCLFGPPDGRGDLDNGDRQ